MINNGDLQKINDLPIEQVADALDLDVHRHWALCPYHHDNRASLYFRTSSNRFRCYACNQHGGPIDLTMQLKNLNFRDAVSWLAQTFTVKIDIENRRHFSDLKPRTVKPPPKEHCNPISASHLAQLVADPVLTDEAKEFLFIQRKLNPRVIEWCGISSTHTHLLIPYFALDGTLQSIQWRYLGKYAHPQQPNEPRFRFPKGCQCHVYNLQILKLLKAGEPLYIAEGCSDCWALLSTGHKAIAIPSATLLKPEDLTPLETWSHEHGSPLDLHMYPDNDSPGERLFRQLRDVTPNVTRHQLPAGCKDFSDYYLQLSTK